MKRAREEEITFCRHAPGVSPMADRWAPVTRSPGCGGEHAYLEQDTGLLKQVSLHGTRADAPYELVLREIIHRRDWPGEDMATLVLRVERGGAQCIIKMMSRARPRTSDSDLTTAKTEMGAALYVTQFERLRITPGFVSTASVGWLIGSDSFADAGRTSRWADPVAQVLFGKHATTPPHPECLVNWQLMEFMGRVPIKDCLNDHNVAFMGIQAPENRSTFFLSVMGQVLWAMAALHATGGIHNDVHPANIMVRGWGAPTDLLNDDIMSATRDPGRSATPQAPFVLRYGKTKSAHRFISPRCSVVAKFVDFGLFEFAACPIWSAPTMIYYRAPEYIFLADPRHAVGEPVYSSSAADVWGLGLSLLTTLAGGHHPFVPSTRSVREMAFRRPAGAEAGSLPVCPPAPISLNSGIGRTIAIAERIAGHNERSVHLDRLEMLRQDPTRDVANVLWGMAWFCDLPGEHNWTGIEQTTMWSLLTTCDTMVQLRRSTPLRARKVPENLAHFIDAAIVRSRLRFTEQEKEAMHLLFNGMLQLCPQNRMRACDVLAHPMFEKLMARFACPLPDTDEDAWGLRLDQWGRLQESELIAMEAVRERMMQWNIS